MARYIAAGTTLAVKKSGANAFTTLGQLSSLDGPSNSVGSVQVTNLDSTRQEYIPGLPDGGDISGTLQFDAADPNHAYLAGLADAPEILEWQVKIPTKPNATMFTCDGFLTEFGVSAGGAEEVVEASITIKVTGEVVISTAS